MRNAWCFEANAYMIYMIQTIFHLFSPNAIPVYDDLSLQVSDGYTWAA